MAKKNSPAIKGTSDVLTSVKSQMELDAANNSGFNNMGAEDLAIPFITLLQALSPQCRGATKIKGAEEGDFFNTVTNEVIKGNMRAIPCAYEKAYVEWIPRNIGGGFAGKHSDSRILDKCEDFVDSDGKNHQRLPNGNYIVPTAYHYCLLIGEDGGTSQVVFALSSTQLKRSRRWNSAMMSLRIKTDNGNIPAPMFSHIYTVSNTDEKNNNDTWKGWAFGEPTMINDLSLYNEARQFNVDVSKGTVKVSPPPNEGRSSETVESDEDSSVF